MSAGIQSDQPPDQVTLTTDVSKPADGNLEKRPNTDQVTEIKQQELLCLNSAAGAIFTPPHEMNQAPLAQPDLMRLG